jgi:hypothetical protein
VPHPPGFYNRNTHQLCKCGSYFDNLVLADDTLLQLQQEINHTSSANQTTLIVSSDHSWRARLWKGGEFWTAEEERVADAGPIDPRPVFLMHFPGEKSAVSISKPEPALIEHDVIAAMLQDKIETPDDLQSFLQSMPQKDVLADSNKP